MAKKPKTYNIEDLITKHQATTGTDYKLYINELPVLSTGIFSVDMAIGKIDPILGNGGLRSRDIMEICGQPGSGKTSLVANMIRTTQVRWPHRGAVVLLASEPPDIDRMIREGINVENLILLGCASKDMDLKKTLAESALDAILDFCQSPDVKLVVIDSVATLITEGEESKELSESLPVASLAKLFNRFVAEFSKKTVVAPLVLVNHYRVPISTGFSFTPPSLLVVDTPGGRTKDFLSMVRIRATASPAWEEEGGKPVLHSKTGARIQKGLAVTYTMFRNKYSNKDGYRIAKATIDFSTARPDNEEQVLFYADQFAYQEQGKWKSLLTPPVYINGSWINIGDNKFQGTAKATAYLKEHPELLASLQAQIMLRSEQFYSDSDIESIEEQLG